MLSDTTLLEEAGLEELPVEFMNRDHAHAAEQCLRLRAALADYPGRPEPLLAALEEFLQHSREHFEREEAAMRSSGFPPYGVHKQEHDRVLAWLESLLDALRGGDGGDGSRRAVEWEIPAWLRQHVASMDLVTARWIAATQ